jgi:hypothetical protein
MSTLERSIACRGFSGFDRGRLTNPNWWGFLDEWLFDRDFKKWPGFEQFLNGLNTGRLRATKEKKKKKHQAELPAQEPAADAPEIGIS